MHAPSQLRFRYLIGFEPVNYINSNSECHKTELGNNEQAVHAVNYVAVNIECESYWTFGCLAVRAQCSNSDLLQFDVYTNA